MPLSFTERRKILKKANYLELHPVRLHKDEIDSESLVTVLIPKFKNPLLVKYFVPKMKSPDIKLKLDELGSAAWILMDGKRNVAAVASLLTEKFGEKIQPVNERLTRFLTGLYEQRLITFQEINK